ncbi:hypothetical protein EON65_43730 [archaeon]|nr:MAG: hypothetical protein EON65_43730 [archaeon]
MIFVSFLVILFISCALAAPSDWVGTFTEPIYGGSLAVCLSTITDGSSTTYYGQALMSEVGYLRGTIVGNVWIGQYVLAGIEAIYGDFTLVLDSTGATYTGNYTQAGSNIVFSASGTQTSASVPSDLECFKVDDSLLTSSSFYDLTGMPYHLCIQYAWFLVYSMLLALKIDGYEYTGHYVWHDLSNVSIHDVSYTILC